MKQELSASIFRSTSASRRWYPYTNLHGVITPKKLNLHEHCWKIFRCHVGKKILLIKAYSTPTSVDANRYVNLCQYRKPLYRYWVTLKLQGCFNFQRPNFFTHITLSGLNINCISLISVKQETLDTETVYWFYFRYANCRGYLLDHLFLISNRNFEKKNRSFSWGSSYNLFSIFE
jgi:hypothetical protein